MERVIFSDNGTLKDFSVELNCFNSKAAIINYTLSEDYLYIGSDLPFNNKYFYITSSNVVTSRISIDYWTGSSWVSSVDIIDETSYNDKSFAQSGHITFGFDDSSSGWSYDDTENITGLTTLRIYGLYWIRISFNASLTGTTTLAYLGQKFSEDIDLGSFYPELTLSGTKTQFLSGTTTWSKQHFIAADTICRDLQVKGIIKHKNQILDWRIFTEASIHKVAEIIFLAFGDDFADNRKAAREYYNEAMKVITPRIDLNNNAILDNNEKLIRTGFMTR